MLVHVGSQCIDLQNTKITVFVFSSHFITVLTFPSSHLFILKFCRFGPPYCCHEHVFQWSFQCVNNNNTGDCRIKQFMANCNNHFLKTKIKSIESYSCQTSSYDFRTLWIMCLRNLPWESMIIFSNFIAQRLLPWWRVCGILWSHLLFKVKTMLVFSRCEMEDHRWWRYNSLLVNYQKLVADWSLSHLGDTVVWMSLNVYIILVCVL